MDTYPRTSALRSSNDVPFHELNATSDCATRFAAASESRYDCSVKVSRLYGLSTVKVDAARWPQRGVPLDASELRGSAEHVREVRIKARSMIWGEWEAGVTGFLHCALSKLSVIGCFSG